MCVGGRREFVHIQPSLSFGVTPFAAKNRVASPPRNAPTKLVHVNHLTRPFTKGQLFEILTEDGPIVQELFWTNRIKSHCIVLVRKYDRHTALSQEDFQLIRPLNEILCANFDVH